MGQKALVYGNLDYMYRDTTEHRFYSVKYLIKKSLPNGKYIFTDKKDTVVINNISDNRFNGEQVFFQKTDKTNYKYLVEYYKNDSLQKVNQYNTKGNLIYQSIYINGVKNGKELEYDENGKTMSVRMYINDSVIEWKTYFKNGKIKSEGTGDFTYRKGFLYEYYESGILKRKIFFIDGVPIYFTSFYENGTIKATGFIDIYEGDAKAAYSISFNNISKYTNFEKSDIYYFDEKGCYVKK